MDGYGVSLVRYQKWADSDPRNYRVKFISKTDGSFRKLWLPYLPLKAVQRLILEEELCRIPIFFRAMAYRKKRSTVHMAIVHSGCQSFLSLDIDNFFPSISYRRIQRCLLGAGTSESNTIAGICTVWDGNSRILPQGSVTAPAISNIVCLKLDRRLHYYAVSNGLVYTRYADDMIFSSYSPDVRWGMVKQGIQSIVLDEGFVIKSSKIKQGYRDSCNTIVGVSL